jgi:hypothetical protein
MSDPFFLEHKKLECEAKGHFGTGAYVKYVTVPKFSFNEAIELRSQRVEF